MGKLLIDEQPLQCQPSLAAVLGSADEAIVLQQLHYWLSRTNNVQSDGHKWIYNSMNDWLKQFPWIRSRNTLSSYFNDLEDRGLVVTGNFKRPKKLLLSHIPLGTTNDLGAIFGLGKNPIINLKMILEGTVKGIDICMINDQPFVYVAGLGKFTDVAYNTPRKLKKNFGYMAYMFNALKSFNQKTHLFEMSYEIDGEVYTGLYSFALVCNARRMAGINVFQDVKMDDGKFEVLFSNITAKKDIIKFIFMRKCPPSHTANPN